MDNLKKASRIRKNCGTTILCPKTFSFIYFVAIYCLFCSCIKLLSIENPAYYWLIFGIMALEFKRLYPLFVIKIFSPLTQHFITTARPSEDKLKEALKLAKEIEEIVNLEN